MDSASPEQLWAWDAQYVWHPFTPHSVYHDEDPLMVVAGEGHELIDADGRRYLDAVSSLWCNAFGHRRPEIDAAIKQQLDRIAHATFLGNATEPAVRLAKRLVDLTPEPLTRVFYSDNGSTAVEIALKTRQYCNSTGGEIERPLSIWQFIMENDWRRVCRWYRYLHARYAGLPIRLRHRPIGVSLSRLYKPNGGRGSSGSG